MNFTDVSITSPALGFTGLLGAIDGRRILEIMNVYTLAFLDHHLRGQPAGLISRASNEFPEVTYLSRNHR
jgi:hypothetical protein